MMWNLLKQCAYCECASERPGEWVSCMSSVSELPAIRERCTTTRIPVQASRLPASWLRLRLALLLGFFLRHLSIKAVAVVVSYAWVPGCLAVWACLPATTSVCFSAPCAQLGKRKPGSSSQVFRWKPKSKLFLPETLDLYKVNRLSIVFEVGSTHTHTHTKISLQGIVLMLI